MTPLTNLLIGIAVLVALIVCSNAFLDSPFRRKWVVVCCVCVFIASFLVSWVRGAACLTNADGTILPPPSWGDDTNQIERLGGNLFTYDLTYQDAWLIDSSNWLDWDSNIWAYETTVTFSNLTSYAMGRFTNTFILQSTRDLRHWTNEVFRVTKWVSMDSNQVPMNYVREISDGDGTLVWRDFGPDSIEPPDGAVDSSIGNLFLAHGSTSGRGKFFRSVIVQVDPGGGTIQSLDNQQSPAITNYAGDTYTNNGSIYSTPTKDPGNQTDCFWVFLVVFIIAVAWVGFWFAQWVKRLVAKPKVVTENSPQWGGDSSTNAPPANP